MKPSTLYARTPESISTDLSILNGFRYNHIPEIADYEDWQQIKDLKQDRIEIRYYKRFDFDSRRFWALASVWFDNRPVMIIQNAGREGDDFHERFITDSEWYVWMVNYLFSLLRFTGDKPKAVSVEDDLPLDAFYGNKLDGYFEEF